MKISRRRLLTAGVATIAATEMQFGPASNAAGRDGAPDRPNIVIFTFDDCDAGSIGCFGCPLPGITRNLDLLAREGLRFTHAFTNSPTCQPSRLSLMTGNDQSTNGTWGHSDPLPLDALTLPRLLRENGYFTAIIGKQPHYPPQDVFAWSRSRDDSGRFLTADSWVDSNDGYQSLWRSPEGFYRGVSRLLAEAQGAPCFLHINTSDPHRPWPGSIDEPNFFRRMIKRKAFKPDDGPFAIRPYEKNYSPMEVPVPGYLPDLPGVRVDLAQYFSALHNGDKALGRVIDALRDAGVLETTVLIVLSDQGASFPMSKQSLYPHGTNLGLVMKWPGLTLPGSVNQNLMSIVDIMPTILDVLSIRLERPVDGRSFASILNDMRQEMRSHIVLQYSYARPGVQVFPMRALRRLDYLYIFNAWHGESLIKPKRKIVYEGVDPMSGLAWRSMKDAASAGPKMRNRVHFIRQRQTHELYDLRRDPYCLKNLAERNALLLNEMRQLLDQEMQSRKDPLLPKLRGTGPIPPSWLTAA